MAACCTRCALHGSTSGPFRYTLTDIHFVSIIFLNQELQSKELPSTRIQPDRRWFGNTRVIGQKQLDQFRTEMSSKVNDAYTVLLREKKLPLQLLEDPETKVGVKQARASLLATQPFADTFGPKKQRKRPKVSAESLDDLAQTVGANGQRYDAAHSWSPIPVHSNFGGVIDMLVSNLRSSGLMSWHLQCRIRI